MLIRILRRIEAYILAIAAGSSSCNSTRRVIASEKSPEQQRAKYLECEEMITRWTLYSLAPQTMVKSENCASRRYAGAVSAKVSIVVGSGVLLRSSLSYAGSTVADLMECRCSWWPLKKSVREEEQEGGARELYRLTGGPILLHFT